MNLVSTKCICGERSTLYVGAKDNRSIGHCSRCGLLRTTTRAENYESLYTDGDQYHVKRSGQTPYRERYEHDITVAVSRLEILKEVMKPRLLDIGCANGAFVRAAKAAGWQAEGLELNGPIADWAMHTTGAYVHSSWDTVRGLFDVVTAHDVIEHVVDPAQWLRLVSTYLTATGYLVIDTPDAGCEKFASDPMASHHMKPLEHLWFFREQDLQILLAGAGFVIQHVDRPIEGKLVLYARPAV